MQPLPPPPPPPTGRWGTTAAPRRLCRRRPRTSFCSQRLRDCAGAGTLAAGSNGPRCSAALAHHPPCSPCVFIMTKDE